MSIHPLRLIFLLPLVPASLLAAPLRHAGENVQLGLFKISDQTLEVRLQRAGDPAFTLPADSSLPDLKREKLWEGTELDQPARVTCGQLTCLITADPLSISVTNATGKEVQHLTWQPDGKAFLFRADAPVFGLGQGGAGFDRRGEIHPLKDGWGGYQRQTHGSRVAIPYLLSPAGWALMLNHLPGQAGAIDLRTPQFLPDANQPALPFDAFLSISPDPLVLIEERSRIEGLPPLPPLWALGYMQSHRTLAGPQEVLSIANTFREKRLPCDALIYLGTGYCPAGWNLDHGSLAFNPATFNKPKEMLDLMHSLGFKVVLHINNPPKELHGLTLAADSTDPHSIGALWAQHVTAFSLGADAWWPDDGDPLSLTARVARHRLYDLGPRSERPNERPWSLHRTGYMGVQKFGGWLWSGDPDSTWETLRTQIHVGLNHSVSLTPFWGSDTGGFIPSAELTSELYVRWFEFSCFTPSFRSHGRSWHLRLPWGWNTGTLGPLETDNFVTGVAAIEDTHNPGIEPICKKYLELRYQLLSYNYALAREASERGLPMMRALWLHHPGDPLAVARDDEFLWGENLLVAPITTKGATTRTLYLPAGEWVDFWTNKKVAGGAELTRPADLATLPLYVRAGTILPLDPVRQSTGEKSSAPLTLRVYPGRDAQFTLYQDDGRSLAHLKGASRSTRISWSDATRTLTLTPADSAYHPDWPRQLAIELPGSAPRILPWDGSALEVKIP
jgi:hypothetical protein